MPKTTKSTPKKSGSTKRKKTQNSYSLTTTLYLSVVLLSMAVIALLLFNSNSSGSLAENSGASGNKLDGINRNPVEIKYKNINSVWHDNGYTFSVENVYLTPDIADAGDWRNNYDIGKRNDFFVVEVKVRNNHVQGEERCVESGQYLRIREADMLERAPVSGGEVCLQPQEDTISYAIFVVNKHTEEVSLYSGVLASPRLTMINFETDEEIISQAGVFSLKSGFADSYVD